MPDFKHELKAANQRLRAARSRVKLLERDNHIHFRGTFPPKPHLHESKKPYQQIFSSGARATIAGLVYAERNAKKISLALEERTFNWNDWMSVPGKEIGKLVDEYHAFRKKQSKLAPSTFRIDYVQTSKKLPLDKKISTETLIEAITNKTKPDSRTRKRLAEYCRRLAEFAGLPENDLNKISSLIGNYSAGKVNPRELPSDENISKTALRFKNTQFGWLMGIIATYGLRPSESFYLEKLEYPKLLVRSGKTGERIVYPLYPEWVSTWNLWEFNIPEIEYEDNGHLASNISSWFYRRKLIFTAMDLRHCYARRCFEFDIAPDRAAYMMGHSLNTHMRYYRAWFENELYEEVYQKAVSKSDRPLPPAPYL